MATRDAPWPAGTPNWISLSVDDPQAAAEFYGRIFGWTIRRVRSDSGDYLLASLGGRVAAGIGTRVQFPQRALAWTTYFAVHDADATARAVRGAGGAVLDDVIDVGDAGRRFHAAAPDGSTFGVWQAQRHIGVSIYKEPGAHAWNELHSRDLEGSLAFYSAVFGFSYRDVSGPDCTYFVVSRPDGAGVAGMRTDAMLSPTTPSTWLAWFCVASCDTIVDQVSQLNGSILLPPRENPAGRLAVVAGPQGERFGVMEGTAKAS